MALASKRTVALTINGVDGFKSGKWNIDPVYTVNSDSSITGSFTSGIQSICTLTIPVISGQTYSISGQYDATKVRLRVGNGSNGNIITETGNSSVNSISFTVPKSESTIKIQIDNNTNSLDNAGTFTFSNIMLNLGSAPAPYEPKRGSVMVMPVPMKNLFNYATSTFDQFLNANGTLSPSAAGNSTSDFIAIKPNTVYILSGVLNAGNYSLQYNFYDVNKSIISSLTYLTNANSVQLNSLSNAVYLRFSFNKANQQIQLEQGATATPYSPYAVQLNQKLLRSLPSKRIGTAKR